MDADDVLGVLHHHWALSDEYYPDERQRLQYAMMIIFVLPPQHVAAPLLSLAAT